MEGDEYRNKHLDTLLPVVCTPMIVYESGVVITAGPGLDYMKK